MKIVVVGAGAIGSLFGGLLTKNNEVVLLGRKTHVEQIKKHGLRITGKTDTVVHPEAVSNVDEVNEKPDLLMITVKSYDTKEAAEDARQVIGEETVVLSLQNGLDNISKIASVLGKDRVVAGTTTEASLFLEPGKIEHTGKGVTVIGELDGSITERVKHIIKSFNDVGFNTIVTNDIMKELWKKAIINACINPLTAIFDVKNGQILKHEMLHEIMKKVCHEGVKVAKSIGIKIEEDEMVEKTVTVIKDTAENYSSMVQSLRKKRRTEIDSINGYLVKMGRKHGVNTPVNELLIKMVKIREEMIR
ncbi:MAG TPA: 2-dehydropantoate 2-reductase [Thermoplasmatales archaeon]|nr:2-dehydropantoate 2-reductase [Thermoplasmatales archaeon]